MAYWRTETLKEKLNANSIVEPPNVDRVKRSAYELSMGPQAYITSSKNKSPLDLEEGGSCYIPPGQFALLLTEEKVNVPTNAIAFISMKFGIKRRGLVNVSGFHVDPGFHGRLKFSVYNAGPSGITIRRGEPVFLIWFADLDGTTADLYPNVSQDQNCISSDDQNLMHGDVASPGVLKKKIEALEHLDINRKWILGVIAVSLVGILIRLVFMPWSSPFSKMELQQLRHDVTELRAELRAEEAEEEEEETPSLPTPGPPAETRESPSIPQQPDNR